MSELKARGVDDVYIEYYNTGKHELSQVYLKSEADKVITEKDETIDELKELNDELRKATDSAWSKVNSLYDELCHHKYKRCLAMVKWCHNQREIYERDSYNWLLEDDEKDTLRNKANIMRKWHKRWLAIAEKFKPNSTAQ